MRLLLFKISIKCEGEKEYWLGINHDALFLQIGRETFSTPSTFVWILRLSSNFIIYSAPFLSFSWTKLGEKKDAVVVVFMINSLRLLLLRILAKKNGRNFYIKVRKREPVAQLVELSLGKS